MLGDLAAKFLVNKQSRSYSNWALSCEMVTTGNAIQFLTWETHEGVSSSPGIAGV